MRGKKLYPLILILGLVLVIGGLVNALPVQAQQLTYKAAEHPGHNCTPGQALEMYLKDKANTVILDVRTRAEYMFVGHPTMAIHLPIMFMTPYLGEKGWQLETNSAFVENLKEKANPATTTIIFMCRSGGRSAMALKEAVTAGFSSEKCYNMLGGFEGDKIKFELSSFKGQRKLGGWRNEGLPWTYTIDPKLAYSKN